MGKIKIPYYVVRHGRGYWQPKPFMKRLGFVNVACGLDGPDAWSKAENLNKKYREFSNEEKIHKPIMPKRGSLEEAYKRYQATAEWRKKAPRTREEWDRAWKRIGLIFGHSAPRTISFENLSVFRESVALKVSEREAHRCIKIWRALWRVCAALGYCKAEEDPSKGVRNTEPPIRQATWTHAEARQLVKTAWKHGFYGLAVAIATAYDTSLSPVDVRQLNPSQRCDSNDDVAFYLDRTKTGRAAYATLSHKTKRLLNYYLHKLSVVMTPNANILRTRTGKPYTKDQLGDDFRVIRKLAFGVDEKRRISDFRRTGAVEALRGGASQTQVGQKLANDAGSNSFLARTYMPVDIQVVKTVDEARRKGRK